MLRRKLPWRSERSHPVRPEAQMSNCTANDPQKTKTGKAARLPLKSSKKSTLLVLLAIYHPVPIVYHLLYMFFYFMSTQGVVNIFFKKKTSSLQTLNSCYPRSHVGKMFWHNPTGRIRNSIQGLSGILSQWYY